MFIPSRPFLPLDLGDSVTVEPVCFPRQAIPAVVKLLLRRTYASAWTAGQHELGRDMIARCIVSLYSACENSTAEAVDRVYRLLDTALMGRTYVATDNGSGVLTLSPPIAPVPDGPVAGTMAAVPLAEKTLRSVDNGLHGILAPEYGDPRQYRQTLADILLALEEGGDSLDPEILAQLVQIAGLLV